MWVAHIAQYGYAFMVKTTLEIQDVLLQRAKRLAKRTGQPLRPSVEESLKHVLADAFSAARRTRPIGLVLGRRHR